MLKQILTAAVLAVATCGWAADNVNVMAWVDACEDGWAGNAATANPDGSYTLSFAREWTGLGVDFRRDHPDFDLSAFTGVRLNASADWCNDCKIYINYTDDSYDEKGYAGGDIELTFAEGKSPYKIIFLHSHACTQTLHDFTLLAPGEVTETAITSEEVSMDSGWGKSVHYDASLFGTAKAGDKLSIIYNGWGGGNSWDQQAQIYAPKHDGEVNANDDSQTQHLFWTAYNSGNSIYTDLYQGDHELSKVLLDYEVEFLQTYGLTLEGHHYTIKKISTLASSNNTIRVEDLPEPDVAPVTPAEGLGGLPIGLSPKKDLPCLFDSDANTHYRATRADRAWAGLDLGTPHIITSVRWMAAEDKPQYVNLGVFEGANNEDFSDALPIAIIRSTEGRGEWNELAVNCSRGFRYVRYVGPRPLESSDNFGENSRLSGSHAMLAELRFFGYEGEGDDSHLFRFSNLPTVIINTEGMEEPHDRFADPDKTHDLLANHYVIDTDGSMVSGAGIARERGNHSRFFPKRPLRMKFDKKKKPVAAAVATKKKWELLNNYGDKTLLRNLLAFEIARLLGMEYVPFCTPVDVVLNGEYRGCYQLADAKEVDVNRVNVHEMTLEEALEGGDALTGGYFVEIDAYAKDEPAGTWFYSDGGYGIPVTVKAPKDDDVLLQEGGNAALEYFKECFSEMERRVHDGRMAGDGSYREVMDVESFLQLLMTNEVAGNKDVMWSFNMYKELGDPHIYSGPAWDFDVAFDNSQWLPAQAYESKDGKEFLYQITRSVADADEWKVANDQGEAFRSLTSKIMDDEQTKSELYHLWGAARDNGLTAGHLLDYADRCARDIEASAALNFERWPIMGADIHDDYNHYGSYAEALAHVKDFITKTMAHFDNVIGYNEGEHTDDLHMTVTKADNKVTFTRDTPYGTLWVKDEPILEAPAMARAAALTPGTFMNCGDTYEFDCSNLDTPHQLTAYVKHAGRVTEAQTIYVSANGQILSVDTPAITPASTDTTREYYTLTGVRVNPSTTAPGIYICRQGTRTTKVILR